MTITITLDFGKTRETFTDVEALTFHPAAEGARAAFEQWTKYQEEGFGSEELVNVNPELVSVSDVFLVGDVLNVCGRSKV